MILPRDRSGAAQAPDLLRPDEQLQAPAEIRIARHVEMRLWREGLATETGQAFMDVGGVANLARLAVADDIDADRNLTRDDIGHRLAHLPGKLSGVVR
jgi:hypothetical protein